MKNAWMLVLSVMILWPATGMADIYRYEMPDGEIVLTTQPRKEKGAKLLEVIRDTPTRPPAKTPSVQTRVVPENPKSAHAPQTAYVSGQSTKDREKAYEPYIQEASKLYGIPVEFIKAVIKIESNFNPRAVSRVGAMGLMQLMPATAEHMKVTDPFDPRQNILGGTRYLRRLSDKYDGDINLVLSGYNAGPGNVEKVGGIPFEKTQKYVRDVYYWYKRYREEAQKP